MGSFNAEKMTAYLDSLLDLGIPSVDCIVYQDHKQIYRHKNGTVNLEKTQAVADDQRYLMFSMTKVQTMTAIMQLVEQGKLSLEDEVASFLPVYKNVKVKTEQGVEDLKWPLKIRHLVSMQSGLDYDLERPGIVRVLKEKGQKATTREIVDAFAETPLQFQPGTHFCYSLSHDVAAAVLEVVTGMSFGEYLKKNLWEPLGMKNTFFARPDNQGLERLAQQYIATEKGIVPMEQTCNYQLSESYESGGAGLVSCTEDYAVLADTIACGGISAGGVRILQPESVEKIKQNLLYADSLKDIANTMGRVGYGYGCGMQILMNPEMIGSTAPAGVFGWDGAAGSCIQMDTASKMSFVFIMHVRNCGMAYGIIHPTLRDMVFTQ
ncbi:MAG: beta-lactamase family protein [Lachnospiraceae bacterium]|nr:beta-lactamase family protein [Lachnospiraceae bacterium]MBR3509343.1 beta-lactamase family protein [Lachnospiraceae bacterium]MBR4604795.1 beta-lactamase family protein [Lachnospiraceae bacterium]